MDWSKTIQGVDLLDRSREMRFRDDHAQLLLRVLDIGSARMIAELGCGPGALARALGRWLGPSARILGVDRDSSFVRHAQRRAAEDRLPHVRFAQGDALRLPLRSGSVDACLSYTVIEHLPNEPFLREQARVTRGRGRVIAMMTLPEKSLVSMPEGWPAMTAREREIWDGMREPFERAEVARSVGRHWPDPADLPRLFEEIGLKDVRVDALALPAVPDDARLTAALRRRMIEAELRMALERIEMAAELLGPAHGIELDELRTLVEARFATRLDAAERGEHIWDYSVSFVLIVSGQP
jgi:ubiquinone/menaquinone biosynthesis C-methylase UbiE